MTRRKKRDPRRMTYTPQTRGHTVDGEPWPPSDEPEPETETGAESEPDTEEEK